MIIIIAATSFFSTHLFSTKPPLLLCFVLILGTLHNNSTNVPLILLFVLQPPPLSIHFSSSYFFLKEQTIENEANNNELKQYKSNIINRHEYRAERSTRHHHRPYHYKPAIYKNATRQATQPACLQNIS